MKKEYIIFSPYFGKLPSNFNLWLKSCSYNKEFNFVVFTDDNTKFNIPNNVKIIYMTFKDFKEIVQKNFNFNITLNSPYKLCDYKPLYGYIFSDMINGYKYWGYCDIDLIFGNISKFLPDKNYDKISYLGHFCLYKNTKRINEMFKNTIQGTLSYVDILTNNQHFGFDEIGSYGINNIFKFNSLSIYNYSVNVADVDCRKEKMYVITFENGVFKRDRKERIFIFDKGKLFSYNLDNDTVDNEYAYVHFQKRKMDNTVSNYDKFIIKYNGFVDYDEPISCIDDLTNKKIIEFKSIKFKFCGIKRRIKRFMVIRKIIKNKGDFR